MRFKYFFFFVPFVFLFSCKTKKIVDASIYDFTIEERTLDSLIVTAPRIIKNDKEFTKRNKRDFLIKFLLLKKIYPIKINEMVNWINEL